MRHLTKAIFLLAALGTSACTNPGRFDKDGVMGGGNPAATATAPVVDAANDPSSPAYFQSSVGDRVLFAVDQSTLTDEARAVLAGQAQWLAANPEYTAIIEGHADEQGTREYNLALGERRASAVQQYLVSQGLSAGRMRTVTYGKERPLEICSDETCYSKNRRAVTVIAAGATS